MEKLTEWFDRWFDLIIVLAIFGLGFAFGWTVGSMDTML